MPSLKDWTDYVAAHPEIAAKAPIQPQRVADLTTKSQTVVAHPGWQMFLDRLATRRELLLTKRAVLERAILDGDGTDERGMKLDLRTIKGELAGLEFASTIIPDMIAEGEKTLSQLSAGVKSGDAAP